jgi:chaperonin GroEL (HSP60 family)
VFTKYLCMSNACNCISNYSQGADIVMKALRAPCRIIAENAGVEGEVG